LTIDASEPQVIEAVLRIEVAGALARCDAAVPLFHHEISPTQIVVGSAILRIARDLLLQHRNDTVHPPSIQQPLARRLCLNEARRKAGENQYGERAKLHHRTTQYPFR